MLLAGADTRFHRPSHLIRSAEYVEREGWSLPGEPERFWWAGLFDMDLYAEHGKWDIASFSCMELVPRPNLHLAPGRIGRVHVLIGRSPGGGIFEAKGCAVLRWASASPIRSRGVIEHPISP